MDFKLLQDETVSLSLFFPNYSETRLPGFRQTSHNMWLYNQNELLFYYCIASLSDFHNFNDDNKCINWQLTIDINQWKIAKLNWLWKQRWSPHCTKIQYIFDLAFPYYQKNKPSWFVKINVCFNPCSKTSCYLSDICLKRDRVLARSPRACGTLYARPPLIGGCDWDYQSSWATN